MLRRKLGLRMLLRKEARVTLAPTWCRSTTHSKNKKAAHKPVKTTTFRKKKTTNAKGGCYTCSDGGHFARDCPNRADRKAKPNPRSGSKDVNMTTLGSTEDGYDNLSTVLSVFQSMSWWFDTGANVHVC